MANYPGTLSSFTTHVNTTEIIDASHPNVIQTELLAVENTLGLNPMISSGAGVGATFYTVATTFATVAARLNNIEAGLIGDSHSQYLHLRGGDFITVASASTVGLGIQAAASPTADLFQITDSTAVKKLWFTAGFVLNVNAGVTIQAGPLTVGGNATITGNVAAQQVAVTTPTISTVGAIINLIASQTADAFQVKNSTGTLLARIDNVGNLSVNNLTVAGTQTLTGTTIYQGQADLTGVTGTAVGTGTGLGDKLELYSSGAAGVGIGLVANGPVVYMPSGQALRIRVANGSGAASSGSDAIQLNANGNLVANGQVSAGTALVTGAVTSGSVSTGAVTATSAAISGNTTVSGTVNGVTLSDTGWITFSLGSGWGGATTAYRILNNVIHIRVVMSYSGGGTAPAAFTVPLSARPVTNSYYDTMWNNSTGIAVGLAISNSTGAAFVLGAFSGSDILSGLISYPIG